MNATSTNATPHYSSSVPKPVIAEIWAARDLLVGLVARNLTIKYQRSALGLLWSFLNPLLFVLVYVVIFTLVIRIRVDGFWAFLISGIFAWRCIASSITSSTSLLRSQVRVRRSVAFPSEILVLSALFSKLVEFLIEITLVLVVLVLFFHKSVPITVLLLPYLILLQLMLTAGLMFPLACIAVLFRDVEHALPAVVQMLFYLSAVLYPLSMIPEAFRPYFFLNPFVGLLRLYRLVLYEGTWPSWELLSLVSATSIGLLLIGYWLFQKMKDVCIEIA